MDDGSERPVAFASSSFAADKKQYSQLDKEVLAIIFGVKHFHKYIYGQSFNIVSDHRPLIHLLSSSKATPVMASARLQRWELLLGAYDYTIAFASSSFAADKKQYSQLDKEVLAIIFGVKHFHKYIYGQSFNIVSDHRPLIHLLSSSKATPVMASARLQRWELLLGAYDYTIAYKAVACPYQQRPQLFPHPQRH